MIKSFRDCRIYVGDLLALGVENGTAEIHPRKYRVVHTNQTYWGEIQVGLTFTRKVLFSPFPSPYVFLYNVSLSFSLSMYMGTLLFHVSNANFRKSLETSLYLIQQTLLGNQLAAYSNSYGYNISICLQ